MDDSPDHIILGCNELNRAIEWSFLQTGVRAAFGGVHPGLGTHNALLALGPRCYLELIAPDPGQSALRWFKSLPRHSEPRLIGWAARTNDIAALSKRLGGAGVAHEAPRAASRTRRDGGTLSWEFLPLSDDRQGLLPFFIQWGAKSIHPAEDSPAGCSLDRFEIVTPDQQELLHTLQLLGIKVAVAFGAAPGLRARIIGKNGPIELTS